MKRRQLILLLGGSSAAAASTGTGAFSSVSADREVSVNVVEDHEAYLGLKQTDVVPPGEWRNALRVTNQFPSKLDLEDVTVTNGNTGAIDVTHVDGTTLTPGEEAYVSVKSPDTGVFEATLEFVGKTDSATVEKSFRIEISCIDVEFRGSSGNDESENGGGAVHVYGEFTDLEVSVNDDYTETIDSGTNGQDTIPPDDGQINRVSINGTVYQRNND